MEEEETDLTETLEVVGFLRLPVPDLLISSCKQL